MTARPGPYGPPGSTIAVCPLCSAWQIEFEHLPGIAAVVEAEISAHLAECPAAPVARPRRARSRVGALVDGVLALIR